MGLPAAVNLSLMSDCLLPPVFAPVRLATGQSAKDCALAALANGELITDGTLYWQDCCHLLDCVLFLECETVLADGDVRMAAEVALTDALGSLLPPQIPVQTVQAAIAIDGFVIGHLNAQTLSAIMQNFEVGGQPFSSDLVVLQIVLPLTGEAGLGDSLADAGGGLMDHQELLTALARQLIYWLGTLDDTGVAPILKAWQARQFTLPVASGSGAP